LRFISLSLLAFRFATLQATITDNVPVCQSFCLLVIDFPAPRSASLGRQVVPIPGQAFEIRAAGDWTCLIQQLIIESSFEFEKYWGGRFDLRRRGYRDSGKDCVDSRDLTKID
jgi:hypothetical protein